MRLLLIGSSGFIGSQLQAHLKCEGHEIATLKRPSCVWDPEKDVLDERLLEGFDAIINLAGESVVAFRWTKAKKQRIHDSRVKVVKLLANGIKKLKNPPKIFISASACGIYGSRGDEELSESSSLGSNFLATVCQEWEAEAEKIKQFGIRTVMLRFGIVLGKGGILKKLFLPFKMGLGGKIGSGKQWMSWITINDVQRSISFLLESKLSGPINLVSPNPVTNAFFTDTVAQALQRPAFCTLPAFILRLVCGTMADELFLSSERVLPQKLCEAGFTFQDPELTASLLQK